MPIRVMIVEDSLTVRKYLVDVVGADPELELVAEAEDGKQAIELCERLRPDVVTMDMMLPVMSGLTATEYIMAYCPTPILIVSASFNRGEVFKTYDALSAGALDVLEKPAGVQSQEAWEQRFRENVKLISHVKVITHPRAKLAGSRAAGLPAILPAFRTNYGCVAIGASTGGPGAVLELLCGLPPDFSLPILLVIHISAPFGAAMCEWLDGLSPIRVVAAKDGQKLPGPGEPSKVIMAPPDRHMVIENGRVRFSDVPERHSCRPSVDVLFESVAREFGARGIACLLTGMGRDGAAGMHAVRLAGGMTIAQDEASSVVFGMPREAIALGAAKVVLPLNEIAPTLKGAAFQGRDQGGRP
jgi:two-component system, chemotaxis family, protein-glutamate methylesterase/glutaminase